MPHPELPHQDLTSAARAIAREALTSSTRGQQLDLVRRLARDLRAVTARSDPAADAPAALRALAAAISRLPRRSLAAQLADLRLFARVTLNECAELLGTSRASLEPVWRNTRARIFAQARRRMPRTTRPDLPCPPDTR